MISHESAEMYLETILILQERNGSVRSVDIANEMGYSKPTISEQMKKFRAKQYITVDDDGIIDFTPTGRKIALSTYERHKLLSQVLMDIGVPQAIAYEDACRVEHYISEETVEAIRKFHQNYQK